MPSEQCIHQLCRILTILEQYSQPDAQIWQEILQWLNEVISLLESELNGDDTEKSSSEEEQE